MVRVKGEGVKEARRSARAQEEGNLLGWDEGCGSFLPLDRGYEDVIDVNSIARRIK